MNNVVHGHEVSPKAAENEHQRQILQAIASGRPVTQRSLARELGIALGLSNLLVRRLVAKGLVKMVGMGPRHVRYLMTSAGWDALGRATRISLENTLHLYTSTREQVGASLAVAAERCTPGPDGVRRVVFYGAGDVAEIGFISLQRTTLTLVGVVDDKREGGFLGTPIHPLDALTPDGLSGEPYGQVIVMSLRHADVMLRQLESRRIPKRLVSCI